MLFRKWKETNIEVIMREELERRNLEFSAQLSVRSGFVLDFAFPQKRIAVECDGMYWHRNPMRNKARDWLLKRGGWTVLHFTEDEIITDIEQCVDTIIEFLNP